MSNWRFRQRLRVQHALEMVGFPRITFFFMLLWTGIVALLASFFLRHLGVTHMGLRYALVVAIAYGMFLLLLWLWLRYRSDPADGVDLSGVGPGHETVSCNPETAWYPGGGQSGGGGASAEMDPPAAVEPLLSAKLESASSVVEVAASAGEGCGVVMVVGLMLVGAVAALVWIVSAAPVFLAEIVLDGFLLAALYRRLRRVDGPYWLQAAWRHTRYPFLMALVIVGILGTLLQRYAPEATSLGAVMHRHSG